MARKKTTKKISAKKPPSPTPPDPPETQPTGNPTRASAKKCQVVTKKCSKDSYINIFGKDICTDCFREADGDLERIKGMLGITKRTQEGGEREQG